MACSQEVMQYNEVTDMLVAMFGDICSHDAMYCIVESCSGDINAAVDAIMSRTSEESERRHTHHSLRYNERNSTNTGRPITKYPRRKNKNNAAAVAKGAYIIKDKNVIEQTNITALPNMSYAAASATKRMVLGPKHEDKSFQQESTMNVWTDQVIQIVTYHIRDARTLIIMRGAPGSGKSFLAHQIQEMTVGATPKQSHIFSSDDYFMVGGSYVYDIMKLRNAHIWNQNRAKIALESGVSPVIIDNTNIEYWEIEPYAKFGVSNGYILEVVEPNTKWARNLKQLTSRNKHGVPIEKIKRMLDTLKCTPISSANIMRYLQLAYPVGMQPPVQRCLPEILPFENNCLIKSAAKPDRAVDEASLQKKEILNSSILISGEGNMSFPSQSNINYKSITHNCGPLEQIKNVVNDGTFSKETLRLEDKLDINSNVNQVNREFGSKENQIGNDIVEILTLTEDQSRTLESVLIHQRESKITDKNKETEDRASQIQALAQHSNTGEDEETFKITTETSALQTEPIVEQKNYNKILQDFEKVATEWDNGEAWDEENINKKEPSITQLNFSLDAKLPRNKKNLINKNSLPPPVEDNDWRKMFMPMSSLEDNKSLLPDVQKILVETKTAGTCMEIGDTEVSSGIKLYKIISAVPRDININYIPDLHERIPEKRMFDKSSMTNEQNFITRSKPCKNVDKHFKHFRNMFKHLNEDDLKDIFNKCCGDVNWAVSIVLDDSGVRKNIESSALNDLSEHEEDFDECCNCTSNYDITPDVTISNEDNKNILDVSCKSTDTNILNNKAKYKKYSPISETTLALKRQIEQNIVISDHHYSNQCLKLRKMRRGELDGEVSTIQNIDTGITMQNINQFDAFSMLHTDHNNTDVENMSGVVEAVNTEERYDESFQPHAEETVNIDLGREFVKQLDTYFARTGIRYSEKIETKINMPISLLNEINALWMESLMYQIQLESKLTDEMVKLDEEFARELAMKEVEMSQSKMEPDVPNLKEIMDMEYALSLYQKECEEIIQKDRPNDLAAKLSIKKLYDLFPEIPNKDLDEIYMAHHYDFKNTVTVLLETQGRIDVTDQDNGVDKFIMQQELRRQEQFLAAEKVRLLAEGWPTLPTKMNMKTVSEYRKKAQSYLAQRQLYMQAANNVLEDSNSELAKNFKALSELYGVKYEVANNIAAMGLLQINSTDVATIDLHHLQVKEALGALDVFLDSHIHRHRSLNGYRYDTVYIITGRGLHSIGGPKIKPAVQHRLICRGLFCMERNPGLLAARITAADLISFQVP